MTTPQNVRDTTKKLAAMPTKSPKVYANSRAHRLSNLDVGESLAEAKRIPIQEASHEVIRDASKNIKGSLSHSIASAAERTGFTYKTESVQSLTQSNDVLVIQVVTRTS